MSLPTQIELNQHLAAWDHDVREYRDALITYGRRKAELEYRRAVVKLAARDADPKLSAAAADVIAEADHELYELHLAFRLVEGAVDGLRARLRWFAAKADALRSEVATERAEAQLYASNVGDA